MLNAGQRLPLETLLKSSKIDPWIALPKSQADRTVIWQNLQRLSIGLEALHSQGLMHRNINRWAVLTAARDEADFQLTGFEWSMRVIGTDGTNRPSKSLLLRDTSLETFYRDWQQLGEIGCDLLGVEAKTIRNRSIPHHEVSSTASSDEVFLLRELLQVVPTPQIDGQKIIERMGRIVSNLGYQSAKRNPKMVLALNLGSSSRLSAAVREASERSIETDDAEAQIQFIKDDLSTSPLAISVRIGSSDRFKLILRGQHLSYTIDDFKYKYNPSNWEFGYCEFADVQAPLGHQIIKQVPVDVEDFDLVDLGGALDKYARLKGKTASWDRLREKLRGLSTADIGVHQTRKALWLTQIIEYLFAIAEIYPVEVLPSASPKAHRPSLTLRSRSENEREALSKALGFNDVLAKRLNEALLGDKVIEETLWTLTDAARLGENSSSDTEWEFLQGGTQTMEGPT